MEKSGNLKTVNILLGLALVALGLLGAYGSWVGTTNAILNYGIYSYLMEIVITLYGVKTLMKVMEYGS